MGKQLNFSSLQKRHLFRICISAIIFLAAVLFIYLYRIDSQTLGRRISIYGLDVSRQTVEEAEQTILTSFRDRVVLFKEKNSDLYQTTLSEFGYDLNEEVLHTELQNLFQQRKADKKLFRGYEDYQLEYQIQKNKEILNQSIQSSALSNQKRTASTDAGIHYDEKEKKFLLIKDVQGDKIDETKLKEYISQILADNFRLRLLGGDIQITIDVNLYQSPSVVVSEQMEQQLNDLNQQLNDYRNTVLTYTFGKENVILDFKTIEDWLLISESTFILDEKAVESYVQDLASKYNTIYLPRVFHTSYGTDITVSNNEYGYQIDQKEELKQLLKDLSSGETIIREPVYTYKGMQRNGTDDLAGSYIEVSLDSQHLWLYKDGTLITETDIVSGAPTSGRETYRGAWPIPYKASPYNLTSTEYGYNVKVNYWMPFVYGQGLHDASWQSSFGGTRYKSGFGSHGCINLPTDQAALIYNTIDGGYPIIIY